MTTLNPTLTAGGRATGITTDTTTDTTADATTDTAADAGPAPRRRLSGLQPTGGLHLGNYLGAIRPIIEEQDRVESVVMIADLHALTVTHDPAQLRTRTGELLATLFALGLDPDRTLVYVQSDVPEHAELHYLLECATGYGEASRMIQFRKKATGRHQVRLPLLTYPVLMTADILIHDATEVPVGHDQSQHLALARDIANRFNTRYGPTFVVPRAITPSVAAKVMNLADPSVKMGKTAPDGAGVIGLLDDADTIRRKIMRAVTDTGQDVDYDPYRRPGVANLLEILAALQSARPATLATQFNSCSQLKQTVADAVVAALRPVGERWLRTEHAHLDQARAHGAARARERARATVDRAKRAIGLN